MVSNIKYLVKFGERVHLEDILKNKLYFTNPQRLKEIEEEQLLRGQGDASEGKTIIKATTLKAYEHGTHKEIFSLNDTTINMGYENLPSIPVFCLTAGYSEDCLVENGKEYVKLKERVKKEIKKSFKKADAALIIKTPDIFINNVMKIFNGKCAHYEIKYFDDLSKGKLYIQWVDFVLNQSDIQQEYKIDELGRKVRNSSLTTENVHRVLFCKDSFFKNQQEYRFVAYDSLIAMPQSYDFDLTADVELVDISKVFDGAHIKIGGE